MNYRIRKINYLAILFSATIILIISCNANKNNTLKSYSINGVVDGITNGEAILQRADKNLKLFPIDTCKIINGKFHFSGTIDKTEIFYILVNNFEGLRFFVDGKNINVNCKKEDLYGIYISGNVQGSTVQQQFDAYLDFEQTSLRRIFKLNMLMDSAKVNNKVNELSNLKIEYDSLLNYKRDYINKNNESIISLYLVYEDFLKNKLKLKDVENFMAEMNESLKESIYYNYLLDIYNFRKRLDFGQIAPNFCLNDTLNSQVCLRDIKSKLIIIDFWSSRCVQCRPEIRNTVLPLYKKYNSLGLEVIGVSSDKKISDWMKAIHEDKSYYLHLLDNTREVGKSYCVRGIPYTILLNEKHEIIEKNLRGEELEYFIVNYFSNN